MKRDNQMQPLRVAYVFPTSHRFRLPFHERLRDELGRRGIQYDYYFSSAAAGSKGDTAPLVWAHDTPLISVKFGSIRLAYQAALRATWDADLVIIQQENSLLVNYAIQIARRLYGKRVAFFGHGRNFKAENLNSLSERFKRFWSNHVDWWFAYTERCADIVSAGGFPSDRITVFNNSIDISSISREIESLSASDLDCVRGQLQKSSNIGVYVGGLYKQKRIPFLIDAALEIRRRVPDFQLIVIGGGDDAELIRSVSRKEGWIHYLGPMFGREKSAYISIAKVMLMPGLVGLAVLDSFVYGTPIVTTAVPFHSPEIDYLENGANGVLVADPDDLPGYATAVVQILRDEIYRENLKAGGRRALAKYSVEAMASRFAEGVANALRRPGYGGVSDQ